MAKKRAAQKRKLEARKAKTEEDDEDTVNAEENGESPTTTKRKAGRLSNPKSSVSASTSETTTTKETKNVKKKNEDEEEDEEDETDYEVEKIVGVNYLKNDAREFLIRWKNYSSKHDTWEPEENLSCPELIRKFLDGEEKKSEKRKQLRDKPKTTSKFVSPGGRKSRRNLGKERSYVENEDSD